MSHNFGREVPLSSIHMTFNERVGATQVAYGLRPERRMNPGARIVGPKHVLYPWPEPSAHHPYPCPPQRQ